MSIKIEGRATVTRIGTWMHSTGPQWELPSVTFNFQGVEYRWNTSLESAISGLNVGEDIVIRGFTNNDGFIHRVTFPLGKGD